MRQHRLGAEKDRFQVHRDRFVEVGFGQVIDAADQRDPGVVDQNVDRPELCLHRLDHAGHGLTIGYVGRQCHHGTANCRHPGGDGVSLGCAGPIVYGDAGAGLRQRQRNGSADAAGGTGDECHAACQIQGHRYGLFPRWMPIQAVAGE